MEPENTPLKKEKHLQTTYLGVPCKFSEEYSQLLCQILVEEEVEARFVDGPLGQATVSGTLNPDIVQVVWVVMPVQWSMPYAKKKIVGDSHQKHPKTKQEIHHFHEQFHLASI